MCFPAKTRRQSAKEERLDAAKGHTAAYDATSAREYLASVKFPLVGEKAKKGEKYFTMEEVKKHNSCESLWVVARDRVFDITEWVDRHPGGRQMLQVAAGRDVTQVFESYHSFKAYQVLNKFRIGRLLIDDEKNRRELPSFPEPSPFYLTLKGRVEQFFVANRINPRWSNAVFLRYGGLFTVMVASYFASFNASLPLAVGATVVYGWMLALLGMLVMHDGSHCAVSDMPWLWNACLHSEDFLVGTSGLTWLYQHVFGHHPYTNVEGADPDIVAHDPDFRRIKEKQSWFSHYLLQHIYAPIMYVFLAFKTRIQDVTILCQTRMNGEIRVNEPDTRMWSIFFSGKGVWFLLNVAARAVFSPTWTSAIITYILSDMVMSAYLALIFQVSHVTDTVEYPTPNEQNEVEMDWAELQIRTSQDYAHDSHYWTLFTGALNYQTGHHLFPGVSQVHLPKIQPIIDQTCEEFGVKAVTKQATFWDAFATHIGLLFTLGRRPSEETTKKSN